jgi:2-oxoglutarate ferredoxin oxidoreductase subunit gamma
MRKEIRICGVGGQGVVLSGFILGKAASVYMKYNAVNGESYGPEARGGLAISDVIISDEEIYYPRASSIDFLICLSQESFDLYARDLNYSSVIIIDPDLVKNHESDKTICKIHAQKIAEKLKNKIVTNIVMIGAITKIVEFLDIKAVRYSIIDCVPSNYKDLNIRAFEEGLSAGKNAKLIYKD